MYLDFCWGIQKVESEFGIEQHESTGPQWTRGPLGCGGTRDLKHSSSANKYAATVQHVNMERILGGASALDPPPLQAVPKTKREWLSFKKSVLQKLILLNI